jgi:hypothetical protein
MPAKSEPEEPNFLLVERKASDFDDLNTTYYSELPEVAGFDLRERCIDLGGLLDYLA